MTDTPTIALYYREHDPMKRKMFLDQSIAAGEDEEANAVRKELWELRYGEPSEAGSGTRADGYLALWMAIPFLTISPSTCLITDTNSSFLSGLEPFAITVKYGWRIPSS